MDAADSAISEYSSLLIDRGNEDEPHEQELLLASSFSEISLLLKIAPGLLLSAFVTSFDISYLVTNYSGRIASSLHQLQNAVWIILAGSISSSCFQPLYAFSAKKYGRRSTILAGSATTTLGLFLCGISIWLWELSMSRILVGIGSSGLSLLTTIILNDTVPLSHLALWRSAITIISTLGLMCGGPLGARILMATNWRIPFLFEGTLLLVALGLLYSTLRLPPAPVVVFRPKHLNNSVERNRLDYEIVAGIIMVLLLAIPLLTLNMGGDVVPWSHPVIICLYISMPFLLVALLYIEEYLANAPIFPIRFFTSASILRISLCTVGISFALNQVTFNISLYAQVRDIDGNSFQDWVLTYVFLGEPFGSLASGILIQRTGAVKGVLAGSMCLSIILYIGLGVGWIKPELAVFAPILILFGVGSGASMSSLAIALFGTVPKHDQATLYALFDLVATFSGDISITVSSVMMKALTLRYLRHALGNSENAIEIIDKATQSLDYVRSLPLTTRKLVLDSFIHALQATYAVSVMLLILGVLTVPRISTSLYENKNTEDTTIDGGAETNVED